MSIKAESLKRPQSPANPVSARISRKAAVEGLGSEEAAAPASPEAVAGVAEQAVTESVVLAQAGAGAPASVVAETASVLQSVASGVGSLLTGGGAAVLGGLGLAGLAAAGGGGGAIAAAVAAATGSVVAGPVLAGNDLIVKLYRADGTTLIGTATVDAAGRYNAVTNGYTGPIIARVMSTGSGVADYRDEATGQAKDLTTVLTAVGVATASGVSLSINPLTTIAAQVAGLAADGTGSLSNEAAVTQANATVAAAFGITGSLIAPTALTPVIDANGQAIAGADTYGRVLATLSGLDEINGGSLQDAIQAFASDLGDGSLTAASKFSLLVASQDPDLAAVATGLASAISQGIDITVADVADVLANSRGDFSDAELADALSTVLDNPAITANNLDIVAGVLADAVEGGVADLSELAEATSQFVSVSVGEVANRAEAQEEVTLTLVGASVAAGDSVTVTLSDQANGELWADTLTVNDDGVTVTLPANTLWWYTNEADTTVTVTTADGTTLVTSFAEDFLAPTPFSAYSAINVWGGLTYDTTNVVHVDAPNNWDAADHWQYRIGSSGAWNDGAAMVDGQALLSLADGAYNVVSGSQIWLRAYDDAGNYSNATQTLTQFYLDTVAPEVIVLEDGRVQLNEFGGVFLLNDTSLPEGGTAAILGVLEGAINDGKAAYAYVTDDADVNQPLSLLTYYQYNQLAYGQYHYYGIDNAGNVFTLDEGLTLDTQAPTLANAIGDQVAVIGENLTLYVNDNRGGNGDTFDDVDDNALTYAATLADGSPLPSWLVFDTATDPANPRFTATAQDLADHLAQGDTLQLMVIASNEAGITVKSISDTFTVTYDVAPNHAPELQWSIGSWDVNVGADRWGDSQEQWLDNLAWDEDGDTVTYTATLADGSDLPDWLGLIESQWGYYFRATPGASDTGTLSVTLTADDGHGGTVDDTFDINVSDDGTVFYPGQHLTDIELTLQGDAYTGSATLADGSSVDLEGYKTFFGDPQGLADAAHVVLDSVSADDHVSVRLGNFATVDFDVVSATELDGIQTWRISEGGNFVDQRVTVQADANLFTLWMDTADNAPTTVTFAGAGDVTIDELDGTYAQYDEDYNYVSSPAFTLDASGMTGNLSVQVTAAQAQITGGSGDDSLVFQGANNWDGGPTAQVVLTGGTGVDSFGLGDDLFNAHVTITDLDVLSEALDLTALTNSDYAGELVQSALVFDDAFADGIDMAVHQDGANADIYLDIDHDGYFTTDDVLVTLAGVNVTDVTAGFLQHA